MLVIIQKVAKFVRFASKSTHLLQKLGFKNSIDGESFLLVEISEFKILHTNALTLQLMPNSLLGKRPYAGIGGALKRLEVKTIRTKNLM